MSKLRFQNRRMKWKKERKEERNRSAEISQVNISLIISIFIRFILLKLSYLINNYFKLIGTNHHLPLPQQVGQFQLERIPIFA